MQHKLRDNNEYNKIKCLQSDVENLIKLIQSAIGEKNWRSDLNFNEITYDDIYGQKNGENLISINVELQQTPTLDAEQQKNTSLLEL